jgi:hypothetical protein
MGDWDSERALLLAEDERWEDGRRQADDDGEDDYPTHDQPNWFVKGQAFFLVIGSITFLSTSSFIPVFNKRLFNEDFHFPVFITSVYLLFCTLGGFSYFLLKYLLQVCILNKREEEGHASCYYTTGKYWRNIVRATALLGIAFGVKLSLTNFGLDLVSVDYHVLFAATALGWVALIGFLLLKEKPTLPVWLVIVCMSLGQVLLSLQFKSEQHASTLGLVINLLTPALQGICVVLMRYSSLLLFPEWMTKHKDTSKGQNSFRIANLSCIMLDFNHNFSFHVDTLIAYTTVKLLFSFLASMPMAILMEGVFSEHKFWDAITPTNVGYISADLAIGAVVTFFLQASLVLLSMLSVAVTLGILSVVKIIPQLALGIWFSYKTFDASVMHVLGIALILGSCGAYILVKTLSARQHTVRGNQT